MKVEQQIVTLSTGKVKPGLSGTVASFGDWKPICPDGRKIQIPLFDCVINGKTWTGLELGRDFELVGNA